jgi:hypothetical protein
VKLVITYGNVFKIDYTTKPIAVTCLCKTSVVSRLLLIRSMRPFFLSKECEEDYVWALRKNLLLFVFPQRLSSTIKNIMAPCLHLFVESKDDEGMI